MWREFQAMNPNGPPAQDSPVPARKPRGKAKDKKVAPLRIKLPKKKSKKYDSEEEDENMDEDEDYSEKVYEPSRSAPKRLGSKMQVWKV